MKYRFGTPPKTTPSVFGRKPPRRQRGVSVVGAIFLITGLAILGALLTRLTTIGNTVVINEWYSAQALYSAESGVDWAAYNILNSGTGTATDSIVENNRSWFTTGITATSIGSKTLYLINSTGTAGTSAADPMVQREIEVQFLP